MSVLSISSEAKRRVACPGCGDVRWLSPRNARGIERGELTGLCHHCRYPNLRAVTEDEAASFARWWLDRFSDEEIAELALGFGIEGASTEAVAAHRQRSQPEARRGRQAGSESSPSVS